MNRVAYIVSNAQTAKILHQDLPKKSYIYVTQKGQTHTAKFSNGIFLKDVHIRDLAEVISRDIVKRNLVHIHSENDVPSELVYKIKELSTIDNVFSSGLSMLAIENVWTNLKRVKDSYEIQKNMCANKPVIIVNSGPSLNKNIAVLKEIYDKGTAIIIASGSANVPCANNGIIPHFLTSVDPQQNTHQEFGDTINKKSTLVLDIMTDYNMVKIHEGKYCFFCTGYDKTILNDVQDVVNLLDKIEVNCTVTTASFSLAKYIGCDPIIFVGQDMIYYDKATHADGLSYAKNSYGVSFRDVSGNLVTSSIGLKDVFDWLAITVPNTKQTVINATEGGAGIIGAEHMTLREVSELYLRNKINEVKLFKFRHRGIKSTVDNIVKELNKVQTRILSFMNSLDKHYTSVNDEDVAKDEYINCWLEELKNMKGYSYISVASDWIIYKAIKGNIKEKILALFVLEETVDKLLTILQDNRR